MEAEVSASASPSGSGGVRGAGEAGRGVAGGSASIASVSPPAKDDCGPKAWKILKNVHAPSSEAMVVVLERQLHAVKINEGDAVQGALDQLRDLYVKLYAAGVDYPKKIKCYKALSLLPKSWGPLVVNLNGMKDSWSLEWIRAQVLQEEFRRKELAAAAGEGGGSAYGMKGFKGRGRKKGKAKEGFAGEQYSGGKRGNNGGKRCGGKCSKGVHGAMGEGMGSEEGDGGAGGHGGMFYHVGEACSEDMVVPASKVALHRSSHWVINTGAFMTMTNQEDLLDEVRPSKAATVVSATSHVVPVCGKGRAMFMGADGRLVGLKRVLLVPGLCVNLLSTKALSEAGMKMEMMGTKVFKATLDGRMLWDLRGGKDMHQSMWETPVLPWKEVAARLAAEAVRGGHASHVTCGGGVDGSDGGLLVYREGALLSVTPSTAARHLAAAHHGKHPSVQRRGRESEPDHHRGRKNDIGGLRSTLAVLAPRYSSCYRHQEPGVDSCGRSALGPYGEVEWQEALGVFGCMGLVHVPKEKRDKLQAEAVWAVHLGLARGSKGWLMWDQKSNTIFTTRDAKFMEGLMFKEWSERGRSKVTIPLGIEEGAAKERPKRAAHPRDFLKYERLGGPKALLVQEEEDEEEKGAEGEMEQICCFGVNLPHEPTSMEEALAGDDREAWLASREDEFKSHMENETWTLTNLPPGRKALDCTWVLRVKTDVEGKLERRKTRLVIKGFQQREGIDFQEVFAPFAKAPTLRVLLATAAVCDWNVEQMDVKTAFLYGVVDEEIYMKQPEGYDNGSGCVCRLNKAIYGLKQAPRCWYARLVEALEALGFKASGCDESLFTTEGEEEKVFLLDYVNDILLFSPSMERIKEVQRKLKETFQCKALGPVGYYLGLHVERDKVKGWLRLNQHKYLAAVGEKYGLEEGRNVKTSPPSGFQLHLDEEEGEVLEYELQRRFQSMAPSRAPGCSREAGERMHGNLKGGAALFSAWAAEAKGSGGGEHKDWCTCKAWALVPLVFHRCYLGK
ncbi:unnamed protein product [Closterium sp. NIES-53]